MSENPWDMTRLNPDDYTDWKYEVGNGDTLRGFEDWLSAKYNEPSEATTPTIVHLGHVTTVGRSRAACGVTYMHPGLTFTTNPGHVTCLRCRGTRRFRTQS